MPTHRPEYRCVECRDLWPCREMRDAEINKINDLLSQYGFAFLQGARGVNDALARLNGFLDDPDFLRLRLAELERNPDAVG